MHYKCITNNMRVITISNNTASQPAGFCFAVKFSISSSCSTAILFQYYISLGHTVPRLHIIFNSISLHTEIRALSASSPKHAHHKKYPYHHNDSHFQFIHYNRRLSELPHALLISVFQMHYW